MEKPNHQLIDKCFICGKRFKSGDRVIYKSYVKEGKVETDPICLNCSTLKPERRVPKL